MKKTLIALMALAGAASAAVQIDYEATWNFNAAALPSEGTVSTITLSPVVNVSTENVTATITTSTGALAGGTTTYSISTDAGHNMPTLAELNNNVAATTEQATLDNYIGSYIKGNKGATLTLTINNLEAGGRYNVSLVSGVTFEGAGSWANLSLTNPVVSRTTYSMVPAKALGAWEFYGVEADNNGAITFTISNTASHSPAFNALSLAKAPEPATATLSLLALAGLAARRRR